MKKTLMLIGLIFVLAAGVFAQVTVEGKTYYYKYVESVDPKTGVKSNKKSPNIYITFTKNSCYESDEKGILKTYKVDGQPYPVYTYQGEQDNHYVFEWIQEKRVVTSPSGSTIDVGAIFDSINGTTNNYFKFIFSKDYKRINKSTSYRDEASVGIYVLDTPPSKAPSTFY